MNSSRTPCFSRSDPPSFSTASVSAFRKYSRSRSRRRGVGTGGSKAVRSGVAERLVITSHNDANFSIILQAM
jgi:hypothetical protein